VKPGLAASETSVRTIIPLERVLLLSRLVRRTLSRNNEITHVNLYKDLLKRRDIALPDNHFTHLYDWQGLAGYNAFMPGGVNRQHYYKSPGVMAMTELLDPPSIKNWSPVACVLA
jgi:hypothetical protein